jgi:hypothetical protein
MTRGSPGSGRLSLPRKKQKPAPKEAKPKLKLKLIDLGALPVDDINQALGLEFEPGEVVFSVPAQKHALKEHPNEFMTCLPFAGLTVRDPTYAGEGFRNPGKIELIRRVPHPMPEREALLVAIATTRDEHGHYPVCSIYPIPQSTLRSWGLL